MGLPKSRSPRESTVAESPGQPLKIMTRDTWATQNPNNMVDGGAAKVHLFHTLKNVIHGVHRSGNTFKL